MASLVAGTVGSTIAASAAGTFGMTAATWAQIGFTAGSLIGSYLFAPEYEIVNEGTRINDLKVTSSSFGLAIPNVYGASRITGNIIWATPMGETRHREEEDSGGKGGGGSTTVTITYTYSVSFAVALCEGEIDEIRRIWFDNKLIYANGVFSDPLNTQNTTIYKGSEVQEPNWLIQADKPDTSAYRGVAYIVFNNIELEKYGNRIPNISAEVIKSGSSKVQVLPDSTIFYDSGYNEFYSDIIGVYDDFVYYYSNTTESGVVDYRIYKAYLYNLNHIERVNIPQEQPCGAYGETCEIAYSMIPMTCVVKMPDNGTIPFRVIERISNIWYYNIGFLNGVDDCCGGTNFIRLPVQAQVGHDEDIVYSDEYFLHQEYLPLPNLYKLDSMKYVTLDPIHEWAGNTGTHHFNYMDIYNDVIHIVAFGTETLAVSLYDLNLNLIETKIVDSPLASSYQYGGAMQIVSDGYKIIRGSGDANYYHFDFDLNTIRTEHFNPYAGSLVFNMSYFVKNIFYKVHGGYTTLSRIQVDTYSSTGNTLSAVIADLCIKSGLSESDLDLTEGDDIDVEGYVVSRLSTARSSIDLLLSAYNCTISEYEGQIHLRKQVQDSIADIPDSDIMSDIEVTRAQESELLNKLTIKFKNSDSDYQTSTQYFRRIDSLATKTRIVDLPLVLSDDQAKQIAETNLFNNWATRTTYKFSVPFNYKDLKIGDVITTSFGECRITKIDISDYINIDAVQYMRKDSLAIADSTSGNGGEISVPRGITNFVLLDVPTLDNNLINAEGLYVAATGYTNTWGGCVISSKSTDVDDFKSEVTILNGSDFGTAQSILGIPKNCTTWDLNSTVDVYSSTPLYDSTEEGVLNGYNYVVIGNEIVQYVLAQDLGNTKYRLSKLLRGRRGTEHFVDSHVIGEIFCLLEYNKTEFIQTPFNVTKQYIAGTIGSDTLSNIQTVTNTGANLRPLSPSYVKSVEDTSGDINLTWMKRSRYISGYMKNLPIVDTPEKYAIDIIAEEGKDPINTYYTTTQDFNYTRDLQIADGDLGVWAYISQMSNIYGKGCASLLIQFTEESLEQIMLAHWTFNQEKLNYEEVYFTDEINGLDFYEGGAAYSVVLNDDPLINDYGKSIVFDGRPNYNASLYTANDTTLSLTNAKAISFWLKGGSDNYGNLYIKRYEYYINLTSRKLTVNLVNSSNEIVRKETLATSFANNVDYFIIVEFNGTSYDSEFNIYVDNVLRTDKTVVTDNTKSWTEALNRSYIATNFYSATYYDFTLDDMRIFSKKLSSDLRQQLFDMKINIYAYYDYLNSLNPIAYWRLNETNTSGTAVDDTGNYNGTYINSPTSADGLILYDTDKSINFEGILGTGVNVGNSVLNQGIRSISFIFNPNTHYTSSNTNDKGLFYRYSSTGEDEAGFILDSTTGKLSFYRNIGSTIYKIDSNQDFWANNLLYYVVGIIDDTEGMSLYINAVKQDDIDPSTSVIASSLDSTYIACTDITINSTPDVIIDEVSVYDVALTEQSIIEMYKYSTGRDPVIASYYNIPNDDFSIFETNSANWVYNDWYYSETFMTQTQVDDDEWNLTEVELYNSGSPNVTKIKPILYNDENIISITVTINDFYNESFTGVSGGLHRNIVALVDTSGVNHILVGTRDGSTTPSSGQTYYELGKPNVSDDIDYPDHTVTIDTSDIDIDYILVRAHGYLSAYAITKHGFKDMIITTAPT